jgi:hypothetical protein
MNRRSRTRFKTDLTVLVTAPDLPNTPVKARLADLSVHGLSLIINKQLNAGASVKVEWGNSTFVGELIYCQPHRKEYLIGLKIEASVYETAKKYV